MRCHQHLEVEADAVCAGCGRGICRQCQQPTIDQKVLCGLPQCAATVKAHAAVPYVIRQSCSNRAAECQVFSGLFRATSLLLLLPLLFVLATSFCTTILWVGTNFGTPWGLRAGTGEAAFLMIMGGVFCLLLILTVTAWRWHTKFQLIQQTWEDLASEFQLREFPDDADDTP
ncbi:MAG: hypothetical protein JSS02_17180 [Planctomycetes bacterium]|nr:hypothetical protein [Planctomycetota bacterium]